MFRLEEQEIKAKQKILLNELSESYWKEFKELSQGSNKEKLFPAQTKSVLLPDFRVSTLNKKTINLASKLEGKVSLLGVSFVRYGESQAESFLSSPSVVKEADQIIRWNIQENPLKGALVYLSKPYIRRNIDPSNWDNYWIYYGNLKFWRLSIGITNTFLGWVMLVDRNLRVRWLANGVATPEELEQLLDLTKSLKQEDQ